jgi:2-iminobutanoate/2-iminopropanoate deaminase
MSRKVIKTEKAPKAIGPYSQAVQVGSRLYISGQLGINAASGKMAGETATEQARQSIENIKALLDAAGFNLKDVVQVQVLLGDIGDFGSVNEVYKEYFAEPYPARAAYQAGALPMGAKVEIIAVAERAD